MVMGAVELNVLNVVSNVAWSNTHSGSNWIVGMVHRRTVDELSVKTVSDPDLSNKKPLPHYESLTSFSFQFDIVSLSHTNMSGVSYYKSL